jgi:putative transposase
MKGYRWDHKRVYRIYRELELNLRIKPRKRIVREKSEPLAVSEGHQPALVDGLHARSISGWAQLSGFQSDGRFQPRSPEYGN